MISVAFSPLCVGGAEGWCRPRLATSGLDGKVKIWDAVTGEELLTSRGHVGVVYSVAFSPECVRLPDERTNLCGTRLLAASADGMARVWDVSSTHELFAVVGGVDSIDKVDSISRIGPISGVAFGPSCEGSPDPMEGCRPPACGTWPQARRC